MTEPEPEVYVPTSEELEAGQVRRHGPTGSQRGADVAPADDDVHSFELRVERSVDRRSRRRP